MTQADQNDPGERGDKEEEKEEEAAAKQARRLSQ